MGRLLILFLCLVACACSRSPDDAPPTVSSGTSPTLPAFDASRMLEHIRVLSSDEFDGRAPGTKGEDLTVNYLEEQLKRIGLAPGNADGTYVQQLPLVGITATNTGPLVVSGG